MPPSDVLDRIDRVVEVLDRLESLSELVDAVECLRVRAAELERKLETMSATTEKLTSRLSRIANGVLSASDGRRRNSEIAGLASRMTALEGAQQLIASALEMLHGKGAASSDSTGCPTTLPDDGDPGKD